MLSGAASVEKPAGSREQGFGKYNIHMSVEAGRATARRVYGFTFYSLVKAVYFTISLPPSSASASLTEDGGNEAGPG